MSCESSRLVSHTEEFLILFPIQTDKWTYIHHRSSWKEIYCFGWFVLNTFLIKSQPANQTEESHVTTLFFAVEQFGWCEEVHNCSSPQSLLFTHLSGTRPPVPQLPQLPPSAPPRPAAVTRGSPRWQENAEPTTPPDRSVQSLWRDQSTVLWVRYAKIVCLTFFGGEATCRGAL